MTSRNGRARWELPLAMGSGIAVAVGAVWITLIEHQVTVSPAPAVSDDWVSGEVLARYVWWSTTLPQSRVALTVLILGLAGAAVTVLRAAQPSWSSRAGAGVVAGGAALWCVADLGQAGAQRAAEQMVAYGNPIEAVASVAYAVDVATSWAEAGAVLLVGAGAGAMASDFHRRQRPRLATLSGVLAVAAVVFGIQILMPEADTTVSACAVGVILLPTWLVALTLPGPESGAATTAEAAAFVVRDH